MSMKIDVEMQPVESSTIKAAGYDPDRRLMVVEFKQGADAYIYSDVPAAEYNCLMAAPSPGKYLAAHIKGKFSFTKQPAAALPVPGKD